MMTEEQNQNIVQKDDPDVVVPFRSKMTYKNTIIFFVIISFVFIGLASYFYIEMSKVIQIEKKYYEPSAALCESCTVQVKQTMKAPVYVMYKLNNFYQNQRRYIQSKSNYQLAGNQIAYQQATVCSPKVTNRDMNKTLSWNGSTLNPDAIASPCGYIAYTFFNDTFTLSKSNQTIAISQTDISWPGDKGGKYKRASNSELTQWVDPQNEHFIVWMRTSGLPNFQKLWGVINQDLAPGNYTMNVKLNYNSKEWQGARYFILTTKSAVGGKNYWLPSAFLAIGALGFIAVIFFWRRMAEFNRERSKDNTD